MDNKQALEILKQILDAASKAGLFQNLESSMVAANAFKVIESFISQQTNEPG